MSQEMNRDDALFEELSRKKKRRRRRIWITVLLILAAVLSLSSSMLALYGPKLSGQAINAIDLQTGAVDMDTVVRCCKAMALCYGCAAILSYTLQFVMIRLSRRVSQRMRHDVFENLTSLPVSFFDRYQTGDIISIITYDIDTVNTSLSTDLLQILNSFVTVSVSLSMMLSIAPRLMLVFLVTIPATFAFTRWFAKRVRPLFRKRSAKLGALNGFVEEMIRTEACRTAKYRVVLSHAGPLDCDVPKLKYYAERLEIAAGPLCGPDPVCKVHLWLGADIHSPFRYDPVTQRLTVAKGLPANSSAQRAEAFEMS